MPMEYLNHTCGISCSSYYKWKRDYICHIKTFHGGHNQETLESQNTPGPGQMTCVDAQRQTRQTPSKISTSPSQMYQCRVCWLHFKSKSSLSKHRQCHKPTDELGRKKKHACKECTKYFTESTSCLSRHKKQHCVGRTARSVVKSARCESLMLGYSFDRGQ